MIGTLIGTSMYLNIPLFSTTLYKVQYSTVYMYLYVNEWICTDLVVINYKCVK